MSEEPTKPLLTDDLRELIEMVQQSDLAEVLIERGDARVHIKRALPQPSIVNMVAAPPPATGYTLPPQTAVLPAAVPTASGVVVAPVSTGLPVTAPMVGTFYASSSPKDPPYVRVGDEVRPGDVVGIIEAMKTMNEIECELHGRILELLVANGQPVEYGQALLLIEPTG
ncbi:MAG: acetyl-CoA carboxylase biotin carboxyl carrier protein [Herpetosiphonaceae bacterium]|nr:acetyl-CoA carboxylase biotin carboxyl carrier protein [Herpetosiphonaceae bacterium]